MDAVARTAIAKKKSDPRFSRDIPLHCQGLPTKEPAQGIYTANQATEEK
jgi:hypothetical protein